jgi:inner membrane protein
MTGKTHLAAGLLAGEAIIIASGTYEVMPTVASFALGVIGGLLPDIDYPHSKISKSSAMMKVTSKAMYAVFKHRGFTHTVPFMLLMSFFVYKVAQLLQVDPKFYMSAYLLGNFSHLFLDSMNPSGIMWLWPISSKRFRFAKIRTGRGGDTAVRTVISIAATLGVLFLAWKQCDFAPIRDGMQNIAIH